MAEPRRFQLNISGAQADLLRSERALAVARGVLPEYLAALREIEFRLTVEPHEWGESREYLQHLRLQVRCGTSRMITVLYGVAEDRDVVFVREFRFNRRWRPAPPSV